MNNSSIYSVSILSWKFNESINMKIIQIEFTFFLLFFVFNMTEVIITILSLKLFVV